MNLILLIILISLSAFFSAAEIAFFSLRKTQIKLMIHNNVLNAHLVWKLKEKPQTLLIRILIGNNIVNILSASIATVLAVNVFGSLGVGIATGVITLLILVFGEIGPKSVAQANNKVFACKSAPIIYTLTIILRPLVWILLKFNKYIIRHPGAIENSIDEEEIKILSRLAVESGDIDYREHEMIKNVFRFDDLKLSDVLTPRYKSTCLNGDVPIEQIAYFAGQEGFSRYPVYLDEEDNIIGYVHMNDIMNHLNSDKRNYLLKDIIRPIDVFMDSENIDTVFRFMLRHKKHLALVQNANKDIVGLVALEDLLEELVGEIEDETDMDEKVTTGT